MNTPDMAAYLLERIAEDEQVARYHYTAAEPHIARHDPARVIAECEAIRRVVELWEATSVPGVSDVDWDQGQHAGLDDAVRLLVRVYAARPDFPPEWDVPR